MEIISDGAKRQIRTPSRALSGPPCYSVFSHGTCVCTHICARTCMCASIYDVRTYTGVYVCISMHTCAYVHVRVFTQFRLQSSWSRVIFPVPCSNDTPPSHFVLRDSLQVSALNVTCHRGNREAPKHHSQSDAVRLVVSRVKTQLTAAVVMHNLLASVSQRQNWFTAQSTQPGGRRPQSLVVPHARGSASSRFALSISGPYVVAPRCPAVAPGATCS